MQYDVSKAIVTATIFFAVFNAGKTCVYAFLTVFLRHLGVTPFQAGLLRCLQTLVGGIVAPSVLHCSGLCAQRRVAMITCIFLTMGTYFTLLVTSLPTYTCFVHAPPVCDSFFQRNNLSSQLQTSTVRSLLTSHSIFVENKTTTFTVTTSTTEKPESEIFLNFELTEVPHYPTDEQPTGQPVYDEQPLQVQKKPYNLPNIPMQPMKTPLRYTHSQKPQSNYLVKYLYPLRFKRNTNDSMFRNLPPLDSSRQDMYLKNGLWPVESDISCFIMLAILLVIGDIVCSPVDKLASTSWFSYLDEIDYTESHRRHLSYVPVTTGVVILLVGLLNLYYCYLTEGQPFNSYHLNFYVFGCLFGVALVMVSFFPQPYRTPNSLGRNLTLPTGQPIYYYGDLSLVFKYFCNNSTSCLLVFTSIINGILYACVHDFVPWYIEDTGGSQFAVCFAIALAFLSDALGKILVVHVQRRLSLNGLIVLGVITYGVRFAFFTALYTSWGIVFTQVVHCFSSVLFWKGMVVHVKRTYDDKKEQQILLVLSSFHYIIGYSIGTVLSGTLYNMYHPLILFWFMSCVAFVWGLFLFFCFVARRNVTNMKRRLSLDEAANGEQVGLFSVDSNDEDTEGL